MSNTNLSYRQLQTTLKGYREDGFILEVKLNAKKDLLIQELVRIETLIAQEEPYIDEELACIENCPPPSNETYETLTYEEAEEPCTTTVLPSTPVLLLILPLLFIALVAVGTSKLVSLLLTLLVTFITTHVIQGQVKSVPSPT